MSKYRIDGMKATCTPDPQASSSKGCVDKYKLTQSELKAKHYLVVMH